MNTYIALFRGINVGGNNLLPMKDLVKILEGLGCGQIKTYIQSGNVLFQIQKVWAGKIAGEIGSKILESHGFEPKVMVLEISELQDAIKNNPFPTADGKALHLFFLESLPENPDSAKLTALKSNSEEFKLHKKVFYLYAPDGVGRSKLAVSVEKCLGVPATGRNWNTVMKLMEMVKE
jgi:uncharacterized protein (DUF1697 family)